MTCCELRIRRATSFGYLLTVSLFNFFLNATKIVTLIAGWTGTAFAYTHGLLLKYAREWQKPTSPRFVVFGAFNYPLLKIQNGKVDEH